MANGYPLHLSIPDRARTFFDMPKLHGKDPANGRKVGKTAEHGHRDKVWNVKNFKTIKHIHVYAVQMIVRMCHMGVHVSRFAQADANKSVVFNVGGERERERERAREGGREGWREGARETMWNVLKQAYGTVVCWNFVDAEVYNAISWRLVNEIPAKSKTCGLTREIHTHVTCSVQHRIFFAWTHTSM